MKPKRHSQQPGTTPAASEQGVAMVLTLLVVAMLTVVVVGFNAATRTEQMAARNFSKLAAGRTMVTTAQQQAAALLATALTNTNHGLVTQPGRALIWDDAGEITTNILSSEAVPGASGELVSLNAGGAIAGTNPGLAPYFNAPWIYVTNEVNGSNQVVGRYAFWIDDDGSRLNLNYAGRQARGNGAFYPTNARPFDASQLEFSPSSISNAFLTGLQKALTDNSASPRTNSPTWGYFFHPRQIRTFASGGARASSLWNGLQYQVAGGPGNMTNQDPLPSLGRFDLGDGGFFTATGTALLRSVDDFIRDRINSPALTNKFGGSFATKYGTNVLRQIAVNISDYTLPTGSTAGSGMTRVTGSSLTNALGIPNQFSGHRPFPYLNEISYRVGSTTNGVPEWCAVEVQVWIGLEMLNPYDQPWGELGAIFINEWGGIDIEVEYNLDGAPTKKSFTTRPWDFDSNSVTLYLPNLPPDSFTVSAAGTSLSYGFEWRVQKSELVAGAPTGAVADNVKVSKVTITPGTISLRQWYDDPATVRDWASSQDFAAAGATHFTFSSSDIFAADTSLTKYGPQPPPAGNAGDFFNATGARGIAKNDPRVRTYEDYPAPLPAWYPVRTGADRLTMGSNNSTVDYSAGTGLPGIPNDLAAPAVDVALHPDFNVPIRSRLDRVSYLSPFELGRVHTGLQWRTLQMHQQETDEVTAGYIPDWALLDAFAVTNAFVPVTTRLNPNALPYPAMTNGLTTNTSVTSGLSRQGSYAALISGFISGNDPAQAELRAGGALTNAGLLDSLNIPTGDVATAGRNLATMRFSGGWEGRRSSLPGFPANAYGTLAEIVEVNGVGNRGASKLEKEQNARVVYESLTPFSDTFTVFAVGQGLEVTSVGSKKFTNVIGEARTMSQLKFDAATGQVRPVYTWPLQ